ncbi:MAG: L17 family ribosomal protein [Candidatus Daviesbacteria bacterium]|nr:L17 family ribosomal protein [Candidatus Daviesbacteria bacterium]
MRHRVYGKHLGRNKNERQALFTGLVHSLLSHGTIETSEAKAKAIKGLIDKTINLVKKDIFFQDDKLKEKIKAILPKLGSKTSGYTSTIRIGPRLGDQTTMVELSLIGAEEIKPVKKEKAVKK